MSGTINFKAAANAIIGGFDIDETKLPEQYRRVYHAGGKAATLKGSGHRNLLTVYMEAKRIVRERRNDITARRERAARVAYYAQRVAHGLTIFE